MISRRIGRYLALGFTPGTKFGFLGFSYTPPPQNTFQLIGPVKTKRWVIFSIISELIAALLVVFIGIQLILGD
jgi:hypothetical protein